MYVVITTPLNYVYGPFSTKLEAEAFQESLELKAYDQGKPSIKKVESPHTVVSEYHHKGM